MYLAPRGMHDRHPQLDRSPSHITLLAANSTGYGNLLRIASAGQLEGFYYRPRVDKGFLAEHSEGIIALSGCSTGEMAHMVAEERLEDATEVARWYRDVFGDRFYVEVQYHEGLPQLAQVNRHLVAIASSLSIPVVATNDVHYVRREHAAIQDVLLCVQTSSTVGQADRMRMSDDGYYLKSRAEMEVMFGDLPDALDNTLAIAERCEFSLGKRKYHLPKFTVPEGMTSKAYLRRLCEEGVQRLYGEVSEAVQQSLDYELRVIHQMGFDDYFLIVWDLVDEARRRSIWWNVRGSGAGSMVAYALGITRLDPLRHQLMFERFLNPGRITMPDIDLDLPDDRRDEMISYVVSRYGYDKVAQIITFGTMGPKAAIRDAGRCAGPAAAEVDRLASWSQAGRRWPSGRVGAAEFRDLVESSEENQPSPGGPRRGWRASLATLVPTPRVVIATGRSSKYTPCTVPPTARAPSPSTPWRWWRTWAAEGRLPRLSTLTAMRLAAQLIEERRGVRYDLDSIPLGDTKSFELLTSGDVTGLFQVESPGMRRVLRNLKPASVEDIMAVIALYRPGPMQFIDDFIACRHGRQSPEYVHPSLEPILGETYGVCVYQEQIIRILTDLAGYDPGEADKVRRAVSKKKQSDLLKHRGGFVKGAMAHGGLSEEAANKIFDAFEFFANYGFNRAHAADYAALNFQTAYLKAHYPVEYTSASLTVERSNSEKVARAHIRGARLGIEVAAADIKPQRDAVHHRGRIHSVRPRRGEERGRGCH